MIIINKYFGRSGWMVYFFLVWLFNIIDMFNDLMENFYRFLKKFLYFFGKGYRGI